MAIVDANRQTSSGSNKKKTTTTTTKTTSTSNLAKQLASKSSSTSSSNSNWQTYVNKDKAQSSANQHNASWQAGPNPGSASAASQQKTPAQQMMDTYNKQKQATQAVHQSQSKEASSGNYSSMNNYRGVTPTAQNPGALALGNLGNEYLQTPDLGYNFDYSDYWGPLKGFFGELYNGDYSLDAIQRANEQHADQYYKDLKALEDQQLNKQYDTDSANRWNLIAQLRKARQNSNFTRASRGMDAASEANIGQSFANSGKETASEINEQYAQTLANALKLRDYDARQDANKTVLSLAEAADNQGYGNAVASYNALRGTQYAADMERAIAQINAGATLGAANINAELQRELAKNANSDATANDPWTAMDSLLIASFGQEKADITKMAMLGGMDFESAIKYADKYIQDQAKADKSSNKNTSKTNSGISVNTNSLAQTLFNNYASAPKNALSPQVFTAH